MNPFDPEDYPLRPTVRRLCPPVVGRAAPGAGRPGLRARLHDPHAVGLGADPARDRPRHRAQAPERPVALRRGDPRARARPLLDQLHPPLRHGARGRAARGAPAGAALRRLPALPARVLRPAPDRAGRLAGDERPLPDPLLHRLGRRPGLPERHDDHRRRDRAGAREPAADALLGRRHSADRRSSPGASPIS